MTVTQRAPSNRYLDRPSPSSLADVIDTILDKGLVIDVYLRVSLVGIEILTIDARIALASVDTYLRFAEAVNRLDLTQTQTQGIPGLMEDLPQAVSKGKTSGAIEAVMETVDELFHRDDEDEGDRRRRQPAKKSTSSRGREPQPE